MRITGEDRHFLLLQGPHGPFFQQLGRMLCRTGAKVWRVGFNRGDRAFWPESASFIPFRGAPEDWPKVITGLLQQHQITDLVPHSPSKPLISLS